MRIFWSKAGGESESPSHWWVLKLLSFGIKSPSFFQWHLKGDNVTNATAPIWCGPAYRSYCLQKLLTEATFDLHKVFLWCIMLNFYHRECYSSRSTLLRLTFAIWSAVLPLAPKYTVARADEILRGENKMFLLSSSWHSCLKKSRAKLVFALFKASIVLNLHRKGQKMLLAKN